MRPIELAKMQNVNLKDDMLQDLFNIVRDLDTNAIRNLVVGIGSLLSGLVASVMGEHLFLFNWLFAFVVADYLTGLYAAKVTHTLSSRVGIKGILRKFVILLTAIGFHGIDQILSGLSDRPLCGQSHAHAIVTCRNKRDPAQVCHPAHGHRLPRH